MEPTRCKYCWLEKQELESNLISPCACKNPVCEICLETHLKNKSDLKCEICLKAYHHHSVEDHIDVIYFLLMLSERNIFSRILVVIIFILLNCLFLLTPLMAIWYEIYVVSCS